jgi:hypothetical protein
MNLKEKYGIHNIWFSRTKRHGVNWQNTQYHKSRTRLNKRLDADGLPNAAGALAMHLIRQLPKPISLVISDFNAEFIDQNRQVFINSLYSALLKMKF